MTDAYIITGFLGSGKTTFLRNLIKPFYHKKIGLIINEFGKAGVDGTLLSGIGAELTEICGGSIFCSCRMDQFEIALKTMLSIDLDAVFVETSGLADPTGVKAMLGAEPWFGLIRLRLCIGLADPITLPKVYATARVCRRQLSVCDAIILNKVDLADEAGINEAKRIVLTQNPNAMITEAVFGHIESGWLEATVNESGRRKSMDGDAWGGMAEPHTAHIADLSLRRLTLAFSGSVAYDDLLGFLKYVAEDTYRIKGFVSVGGATHLVDCVGGIVEVKPYLRNDGIAYMVAVPMPNQVTVLYGNGLPARSAINEAIKLFPSLSVEIID